MKKSRFPKRWDEKRVKRVLANYEKQTEEEALAEDEAAYKLITTHTLTRRPIVFSYSSTGIIKIIFHPSVES